MKRAFRRRAILSGVLLLGLMVSACTTPTPTPIPPPTLIPTSAPTSQPTPTSTLSPTLTPSPTVTPTNTPLDYDGRWDGGTESNGLLNGEILFLVANNKVTEIGFNYTLRNSGCTLISSMGGPVLLATTNGNNFTAGIVDDGGKQLTLTGTFSSAKQANGTLEFKGTMEGCPAFDRTVNWTAENVPVPPTDTATTTPTESPTALPTSTAAASSTPIAEGTPIDHLPQTTPTPESGSPSAIVQAFFKALNAHDMDGVRNYADENIVFSFGSRAKGTDSIRLQVFLITDGTTYTLSDVKESAGGVVSFTAKSSQGETFPNSTAVVSDGKIQVLALK